MPGTKIAKEYIEFSDSTKQYASFPLIGNILMWSGDYKNIPEGYLLCDGEWIENAGDTADLYQKLNGLYDKHPIDGLSNKPSSGEWHRVPFMCKRYPLGTENWSTINQDNVYGGSNKLVAQNFVHKHKFDKNGFVHTQNESKCWTGNGSHLRGKNTTASFNTEGVIGGNFLHYEDSLNEEFLPMYSVLKYIIRYK
jgi:hypothetical protein